MTMFPVGAPSVLWRPQVAGLTSPAWVKTPTPHPSPCRGGNLSKDGVQTVRPGREEMPEHPKPKPSLRLIRPVAHCWSRHFLFCSFFLTHQLSCFPNLCWPHLEINRKQTKREKDKKIHCFLSTFDCIIFCFFYKLYFLSSICLFYVFLSCVCWGFRWVNWDNLGSVYARYCISANFFSFFRLYLKWRMGTKIIYLKSVAARSRIWNL